MRRVRKGSHAVALAATLVMLGPVVAVTTMQPASASNVGGAYSYATTNGGNGDGFETWDNLCATAGYCSIPQLADNPVNMIYFNNADVRTVRTVLTPAFCCGGGAEYQFFQNVPTGNGLLYAGDTGRKNCAWGSPYQCNSGSSHDVHYRLYPEVNQYTFGSGSAYKLGYEPTGWGFYAVETSHYDINEGAKGCTPTFGYSEEAEGFTDIIATMFGQNSGLGWTVYRADKPNTNGVGLGNSYTGWADCNHYYDSNGIASAARLP